MAEGGYRHGCVCAGQFERNEAHAECADFFQFHENSRRFERIIIRDAVLQVGHSETAALRIKHRSAIGAVGTVKHSEQHAVEVELGQTASAKSVHAVD